MAQGDCDDADASTYPTAPELCDGQDNNCNGVIEPDETDDDGDGAAECTGDCDDGDATLNVLDLDADGWTTCDGDCNDNDASLDPSDADGDGWSTCAGDCDDDDPDLEPADADGDGYSTCGNDCDDADPTTYPAAPELCDGLDNNCNGVVATDETDDDGDGAAECAGDCDDTDVTLNVMDLDADGWTTCDGDCNDTNAALDPADADGDGWSSCDGDCDDDDPDLDLADADGDGHTTCDGDCDDTSTDAYPGAPELCNGQDDNCNGVTPADEQDVDADGWLACEECDDADPAVHPAAAEVCGYGVDDDCDGTVDEGCTCPLYVDGAAVGSLEQGTWDDPFLDLTTAFDNLTIACFEVHVAPGSYAPGPNLDGDDLILRSIDGSAATVIDAGGSSRCMKFKNAQLVLDGFTLRNGNIDKGAGLMVEGSSTTVEIAGCVFEDNTCTHDGYGAGVYVTDSADFWMHDSILRDNICDSGDSNNGSDGGGLFADAAAILVEDCEFTGNEAGDGGAIATDEATGTVNRCLFAGNLAWDTEPGSGALHGGGALAVYKGSLDLTNNLIVDNESSDEAGGLLVTDSDGRVDLDNCTLAYNTSLYGGAGLHVGEGGNVWMRNSIIAYNDGDAGMAADAVDGAPSQTYCDVFGNLTVDYGANTTDLTGSNGNISDPPLFMSFVDNDDPTDDDLHLDAGSACIDTGDPTVLDFDGTNSDMGAYGGMDGGW